MIFSKAIFLLFFLLCSGAPQSAWGAWSPGMVPPSVLSVVGLHVDPPVNRWGTLHHNIFHTHHTPHFYHTLFSLWLAFMWTKLSTVGGLSFIILSTLVTLHTTITFSWVGLSLGWTVSRRGTLPCPMYRMSSMSYVFHVSHVFHVTNVSNVSHVSMFSMLSLFSMSSMSYVSSMPTMFFMYPVSFIFSMSSM